MNKDRNPKKILNMKLKEKHPTGHNIKIGIKRKAVMQNDGRRQEENGKWQWDDRHR
jgi:hypothetical protein